MNLLRQQGRGFVMIGVPVTTRTLTINPDDVRAKRLGLLGTAWEARMPHRGTGNRNAIIAPSSRR